MTANVFGPGAPCRIGDSWSSALAAVLREPRNAKFLLDRYSFRSRRNFAQVFLISWGQAEGCQEKQDRGQESTASVIEVQAEDIDRLAEEVKEIKALPPVKTQRIGFSLGEDEH